MSVLVSVLLALGQLGTSFAAGQPNAALSVQGVLAEYTVNPGQTITHVAQVQLGPDAQPLDMVVEPGGLGQAPDGSPMELAAADDKSPYSARGFLQSVEPQSFHLNPGQSVAVKAVIVVPPDVSSGIRYADIYIHSKPSGGGQVGFVLGTHVPVILQIGNEPADDQGQITAVNVENVVPGQPIAVKTSFENTGTIHFKAQDQVSLVGSDGTVVGTQTTPLTNFSIVPTFTREFVVSFELLDQLKGLPAGRYTAESKVLGPDGKVIDTKRATFDLAAPYQPFPGIDPNTLVVTTYNKEVPHPIDARSKAGLDVSFSGTDAVTGVAVVGRFKAEAPGDPRLSASPTDGGLGQTGVTYYGVGVQGFSNGTARITAYYSENDAPSAKASGLYLAYRVGNRWAKLNNVQVFTGAQNVQGDLPVDVLNENPIIALALDETPAAPVAPAVVAPKSDLLPGIDPLLAVGVGGTAAIVLTTAFVLTRTARSPLPTPPTEPRPAPGRTSQSNRSPRSTYNPNQLANGGHAAGTPRLPHGKGDAPRAGDDPALKR